jgi:excinuclease ABC subunit B
MERAMTETLRRRSIQLEYNKEHGIVPKTIIKDIRDVLEISTPQEKTKKSAEKDRLSLMTGDQLEEYIAELTEKMMMASEEMNYELAITYRDKIAEIKGMRK